uniref:Pentatricopeptide repeat-containing protein n=1 Tax=Kalanchoe fedtschenkoi TaxID=63787 RepID=A0A7N0ZX73_KALFE
MFVKLPPLDTASFCILGTSKLPLTIKIALPPPDKVKQPDLQIPNVGANKLTRVYRKQPESKPFEVLQDPNSNLRVSINRLNGRHSETPVNGRNYVERCELGSAVVAAPKQHTKCSTKWAAYGGAIPAIFQALDSIEDVGEALGPWKDDLNNKERSIILKEQVNWERALAIFQWFKDQGCYELNVIHYNIMIRIVGKARQWTLVRSLWDEMRVRGIVPINSTYGTLIDVNSKGGRKEEALCWLGLMNEKGMEPDEVTMGIVVQLYKKSGEFKKAEQFFMRWSSTKRGQSTVNSMKDNYQAGVHLSSYTFNNLIDTYGKAGQLEEASRTFAQMLRDGIVPNTITFNTMIHICGNNGRLQEVESLMQKMDELRCPFDTRTYNILISLHTKHDNIQMASYFLKKMKAAKLQPDIVSYRTLLYAYSIRHMVIDAEVLISEIDNRGLQIDEFTQSALTRMYIEAGMREKSWLWFERFHLKGSMTSECYAANLDAFGERGHLLEAEQVFFCCQEARRLSVLAFNVMIKAYGIGKRYDKACELFGNMESNEMTPDKCTYNCLIQMLANADKPFKARVYLRKMQGTGFIADCIPYCAVISCFAKLGMLEQAEDLFKEMISHNVHPDIVVYGVLINAFADTGNVKNAMQYVDAVRNSGLKLNDVICNSLIKLYTKVGYLKEAWETYEELKMFSEAPDIYSSNCMIDLYSERSMVKEAEEIFGSLKAKGLANEFSFAMMLCMYRRIGMFEEAVKIAQKMSELGLLTDLLSFNNVLGLYASDGRFKDAIDTFNAMLKLSIKPDDSTFKSLGVILMKRGFSKQAIGKLEMTRKMDPQRGLQAWMSTLTSAVMVEDDWDS